ncbi:MAG TPA: alcohol dehydrogenase [Armatimonadetes bacterium]|nr:alcohol dehydrogenase [Armatimonadota bacterium]
MKGLVLHADWKPKDGYTLTEFEKETGKAINGNSVWHNPRLSIEDLPEPSPQPGQVLLEIKACGVCGSDMHFYETDSDGYILYPGLTKFPCVLGHELSGRVVALGEGVKDLKIGDMVCAEEMIWCGDCTPCRNGFPNQCSNLEEIGFTIDGAFAKYMAIGARYCWKIDSIAERYGEDSAWEMGAMVEPSCVAYNAIFERGGGFRPGGYAVIFGAGPIGLASIGLCKAAGAAKVLAFDISPTRRELASKMGADSVHDPSKENPVDVILGATGGEGADFMIESAGVPAITYPSMEKVLAVNARIVQASRAAEKVPIYLENFQVRAAQIFGAQGHSGNGTFPNVIRLMAAGRLDMRQIVTSRYSLKNISQGIAKGGDRTDGKIMARM